MATSPDSVFYRDLAEHCFKQAERHEPSLGANGMRVLGQQYLELAKRSSPGKAASPSPENLDC